MLDILAMILPLFLTTFLQDTGTHVSLDTTSTYLSLANDRFKRLPQHKTATTHHDQMLIRSYERTYLTLFNYDRGSALVMGEPLGFTMPEKQELVGSVNKWAAHPDATEGDWTLGALVSLRRDVVRTFHRDRLPSFDV